VAAHRVERVAEVMREELEELIAYELEDPRIGGVTIAEVVISKDFKKAFVRLTPVDESSIDTTVDALGHARAFLRSRLAERLQLRRTPELVFEASTRIASGRVETLLKRIRRGRPRQEPDSEGNSQKLSDS